MSESHAATHRSIERNNLAISFMERRDFGCAITLMNESLWMLKEDGSDHGLLPIVGSLQQRPEKAGAQTEKDSSYQSTQVPLYSNSHPKKHHHHHRQDIALDDALSVFEFPLRINPETVVADDTFTEICAILSYNCALAHHLHGIDIEDDGRRNAVLKQALALYQRAHSIHLQQEAVQESDVSFTLAILNNVAQLQGFLGNTEVSTRCVHRMLRILMVLVSRHEKDSLTAETDLFFANCSRVILEKPAAPAA